MLSWPTLPRGSPEARWPRVATRGNSGIAPCGVDTMGPKIEPVTGACRLRRCEFGDLLPSCGGALSRVTVTDNGFSGSGVDGREDWAVAEGVRSTSFEIVDDCMMGEMRGEVGYQFQQQVISGVFYLIIPRSYSSRKVGFAKSIIGVDFGEVAMCRR